ncbi:hypothetical protein [Planktothrix sp. FACHB-1365]|uniref:hypothetical protein n=1 Tax=Planktothrix sp. FACHB-1365 TaxID=2692855 RepID=UPI001689ACE5|nr:hypothetical protein [Planktothrix sp. FACHB-1365]MBD2485884.1 hypothetical protein [Planktothrix sp. FACHB-1365]
MLSETVDYAALKTLFEALELDKAKGYRYLKRISKILGNTDYWKYKPRDGALNNDGIKIFELFTTIAKEHSPQFAEKQLIEELKNHGYNIPETNQNNRTNYNKGTARNEQPNSAKQPNFYDTLLGL